MSLNCLSSCLNIHSWTLQFSNPQRCNVKSYKKLAWCLCRTTLRRRWGNDLARQCPMWVMPAGLRRREQQTITIPPPRGHLWVNTPTLSPPHLFLLNPCLCTCMPSHKRTMNTDNTIQLLYDNMLICALCESANVNSQLTPRECIMLK